MEKGAEQVAARRAADQEYRRRRRSDSAARSTENADLKRRRQTVYLICDTHITVAPRQLGYTATAANNQTRSTCISTAA